MLRQNRNSLQIWVGWAILLLLLGEVGWLVRDSSGAQAALSTNLSANVNGTAGEVIVGRDSHHDTSPPLRDIPQSPPSKGNPRMGPENPRIPNAHKDLPDASAVQR